MPPFSNIWITTTIWLYIALEYRLLLGGAVPNACGLGFRSRIYGLTFRAEGPI